MFLLLFIGCVFVPMRLNMEMLYACFLGLCFVLLNLTLSLPARGRLGYDYSYWDMLRARETNTLAWFVMFIVLPLVSYFLLQKCNEISRRKESLSQLAEGAAEEAVQGNDMATGTVMPVASLPNAVIHQCARCFGAAKTRCSKCKSVWYCSGRCQIVHWRHSHKFKCLQLGSSSSKPIMSDASSGILSYDASGEHYSYNHNELQPCPDPAASEDFAFPTSATMTPATFGMTSTTSVNFVEDQRSANISTLLGGNKNISSTAGATAFMPYGEVSGVGLTHPTFSNSSEVAYPRKADFRLSQHNANICHVSNVVDGDSSAILRQSGTIEGESVNVFSGVNKSGVFNAPTVATGCIVEHGHQMEMMEGEYSSPKRVSYSDGIAVNLSSEKTLMKKSSKSRNISTTHGTELHKSPDSKVKVSKESLSSDAKTDVQTASDSRVAMARNNNILQETNEVAKLGVIRTSGLKKSEKTDSQKHSVDSVVRQTKTKMIFPYAGFIKYYQFEVFGLTTRGFVNCGNSCYANAVLQCLTFTKPLTVYLLSQSHSRAGCAKDWCLMCELEQLVLLTRESGGPVSPINILVYIRSLNSQIGDGSQEDAHEFLRLLVASMQSVCLESFGGESAVSPRLQDTTFIQHTFGGWLRSKVTCLRCSHESERHEKLMDLTLEINGRVQSLEDALAHFTSPEDLDGDNMYRCQRCAEYVQARKQFNVQLAPNILTIVLKRFQEGNHGKINKFISFPETLDMVPFMIGTDDVPPPYMLYAVVVHMDTPDSSFSGHYISYVKDLQGHWLRVDDTEVQPVELSNVMSEDAYILFYMRSRPRSARGIGKATRHRTPCLPKPKQSSAKVPKASISELPIGNNNITTSSDCSPVTNADQANTRSGVLIQETRIKPSTPINYAAFSDANSSDRSLFTGSDDSSFTTDSARDSLSMADHSEAMAFPPILRPLHPTDWASQGTISCSMFPAGAPQMRFAQEVKGTIAVSPAQQVMLLH